MKIKKYKELILLIFLSLIINFSTINTYPVLDRDEARYAQSTKQMLETGNYKSIKFQEELRSKKPVGIYWLQAITVNILSQEILGANSHKQYNKIWKYRFISCLFSFLSCLALYLIASKVFNKNIAFLASIILNCTLLFIIESHTAKTDSVLLTFSVISMVLLCGYFKGIFAKQYDFYFFLLWTSIGLSVLVKGPILILMVLFSIIFIYFFKKNLKWILNTNPIAGIVIIITIVMPWFLSISGAEQSSFFTQGIKRDFLDKLIGVQESHGAFFGAHTLSIFLLFFPMNLLLFPSILKIIRELKSDESFFLLAWIVPNLFILELIPTKLPHYALPLYPALALIMASYITDQVNDKKNSNQAIISIFISNLLYILSFTILIVFFLHSLKQYSSSATYFYYLAIILLLLLFITSVFINFSFSKIKSFYYQSFIACVTSIFIFSYLLPKLDKVWISKNIYETLKKDNINFYSDNIVTIGFNEPSLIFMLGTKTKILFALQEDFFEKKLYKYIILEKKYLNEFNKLLKVKKYDYKLLNEFNGFNSAKNKWINTLVFKLN